MIAIAFLGNLLMILGGILVGTMVERARWQARGEHEQDVADRAREAAQWEWQKRALAMRLRRGLRAPKRGGGDAA